MQPPSGIVVARNFSAISPVLDGLIGSVCNAATLSVFCNAIIKVKTSRKLERQQLAALERSTEHLMGQEMTKQLLHSNAYRVLANWHFIKEGMPIPVWEGDPIDCACTFLSIDKKRETKNDKLFLKVRVKLRSGLAAGIIYGVAFTPKQIGYFLKHISGAKAYNCAIEEFSGMRAQVTVEMQGEELHVLDWKCTESDRKYNRELAEARRNPRKCNNQIPCNACPRTVNACNLAIWTGANKETK